jgi:hypothetical protein
MKRSQVRAAIDQIDAQIDANDRVTPQTVYLMFETIGLRKAALIITMALAASISEPLHSVGVATGWKCIEIRGHRCAYVARDEERRRLSDWITGGKA